MIGLQLRQNKEVFSKFYWDYMGGHGEIHLKHRLLSKKDQFSSSGDQSYEKKINFFLIRCKRRGLYTNFFFL